MQQPNRRVRISSIPAKVRCAQKKFLNPDIGFVSVLPCNGQPPKRVALRGLTSIPVTVDGILTAYDGTLDADIPAYRFPPFALSAAETGIASSAGCRRETTMLPVALASTCCVARLPKDLDPW